MCTHVLFFYRSSEGCEPARWPSLAWWVLSWAGACPQTEQAASVCTWLDRPWFPIQHTHTQFTAIRSESEKSPVTKMLKIYLSEYSDTDVLTTGFIDETVQLLRRKWTEKKQWGGRVGLLYGNSFHKTLMWVFVTITTTYTVMTLSLGSGGRPTVSCLWWEIRSVQAWTKNTGRNH